MLTDLQLRRFKAFPDLSLSFGKRVTVLIGANGTGKSSVLQILTLLKQSLNLPALRLTGPDVSVPGEDIVLKGERSGNLAWEMGIGGNLPLPHPFGHGSFGFHAWFNAHNVSSATLKLYVGNDELEFDSHAASQEIEKGMAGVTLLAQRRLPNAILPILGIRPRTDELQSEVNDLARIAHQCGDNITYIHPLRGMDRAVYDLLPDRSVGLQDPNTFATNWAIDFRTLEDQVSDWMSRITGVKVSHNPLEQHKISMETKAHEKSINIISDGFGTNQLWYLLTRLHLAGTDSAVLLEEPEVHLHPAAQQKLVDVAMMEASQTRQLVLTTHSEHVLYALLNQVAKGNLVPEDLKIWYFTLGDDGGASASPVEITEEGMVFGGLPGFFESDLNSAQEFLEALRLKTSGSDE